MKILYEKTPQITIYIPKMDIKELRDFLNSERTEYLNLSDEYLKSHSVDKADYKFISYKPADTIYL